MLVEIILTLRLVAVWQISYNIIESRNQLYNITWRRFIQYNFRRVIENGWCAEIKPANADQGSR